MNGIFQIAPDGRYTAANPALVKMLGYDSSDEFLQNRTYNAKENYADPSLKGQFQDCCGGTTNCRTSSGKLIARTARRFGSRSS